MSANTSYQTNLTPADAATEHGRLQFIIRTAMSGMRTAIPVQVVSVTNSGGVSPIGTVSVQPLVSMVDGGGTVWPHGIIHNVPYMRIQGGANAVIIDPQVGDIGLGSVCDRDISGVQKTGAAAAPGSARKYDLSDIVYLMTIISAVTPTQYVQFDNSGITVTSPNAVNVNAPVINIGPTSGILQALVNASVEAIYNGHTHISAASGSPTSTPNNSIGPSQLTTSLQAV